MIFFDLLGYFWTFLSALRLCSQRFSAEQSSSVSPESDSGSPSLSGARDVRLENLLCSDVDYTTAELIGSKLILHMAAAYRLINGDTTELVPAIQTTCQKQLLFTRLNNEFEHHTLIKEAGCIGISRRTAMRWNNAWQDEGLITKLSHGLYKKIS